MFIRLIIYFIWSLIELKSNYFSYSLDIDLNSIEICAI